MLEWAFDWLFRVSEANVQWVKEFKEFAVKGNVVDMAVGIIIGAAFTKIVSSFVGDLIMPPLGLILGGVDFSGLQITLKHAAEGSPAVMLRYGAFLQQVFDFTIVALAMFMLIKAINRLRVTMGHSLTPPPAAPKAEEVLLTEIRDILKGKTPTL